VPIQGEIAKAPPHLTDNALVSFVRKLRSRLTYANAVSSIALFVALGGGAYAVTVPRNSVGQDELKPGSVTAAKVRNHSLTASDFRRNQLPVLGGARTADLNPPPRPGTVVKTMSVRLKTNGRAFVLGTVRDVFLSCGAIACRGQWGVYVDNHPVPSTGMVLQAGPGASDGYSFFTLYGLTKDLKRGAHTVELARSSSGSPTSAGQLGAQLGALTLGG
jgi:hypothetical protein